MTLATQVIPCGAQNLGGGYTAVPLATWGYRGVRQGRTYRIRYLGTTSGNNMGVSYNGDTCTLACDAWYPLPEFNTTAPAGAWGLTPIGRNSGSGNTVFTDYEVQDAGSDEGVATVQCKVGLAGSPLGLSTPGVGRLLVAHVAIYEQGAVGSGVFASVQTPSGWIAATTQGGYDTALAKGCHVRTFYKVSDGTETSLTLTSGGTAFAAPDSVAVMEYGGVGSTLLGTFRKANAGVDTISATPPAGAKLACIVLAVVNQSFRFDQADTIPWLADYWSPNGVSDQIVVARDVDPSGLFSVDVQNQGGGDAWVFDAIYFGAASGGSSASAQPIVIA